MKLNNSTDRTASKKQHQSEQPRYKTESAASNLMSSKRPENSSKVS